MGIAACSVHTRRGDAQPSRGSASPGQHRDAHPPATPSLPVLLLCGFSLKFLGEQQSLSLQSCPSETSNNS